ncbi:hypothetical protein ES703_16982 [subsurface metagenome]
MRKYLQLEGVGDGIGRIHMLKKIVKEADNIVTDLHNIDASWIVSGILALARIPHHHTTHEPGGVDVVTGVAPGAHKDTHDPEDGADPLDTAIPVKVGAANAEGTSHSLARADHVHEREHTRYTDGEADARIAIHTTPDAHHAQDHSASHESGGGDELFDQNLNRVDNVQFGEVRLTPKASSSGAEGTIFYDSVDKCVYVGVEV